MAVVMLHGKFTRHIPSEYYRRTVDAVMFQKFSVGDLLFYRDCPSCTASVRFHQFPPCRTQHVSCLFQTFQLFFQLAWLPPVICIQKSNVGSLCQPDSSVSGACSSHILLILNISKVLSALIGRQDFLCMVCGTVIDHQKFQRNFLFIDRFHSLSNIFLSVVNRHDHRYQRFIHGHSSVLFSDTPAFFPESFNAFTCLSSTPSDTSFWKKILTVIKISLISSRKE